MSKVAILGGHGFIGAALSLHFFKLGDDVEVFGRGDDLPRSAGHLFFCAGLTADFRQQPFETVDSHVSLLNRVLRDVTFTSLTYCSSTRVYQRAESGSEEARLMVDPSDPSDLYNITKLAGEARCLSDPRESIRIARLSNVFGPGDKSSNFLSEIVRNARDSGQVHFLSGADAAKDYIALEEAVTALAAMPVQASSRVVNLASGTLTSNKQIGDILNRKLGSSVTYGEGDGLHFPVIRTSRMREELGVVPREFASAFDAFLDDDA